MYPKMLSLTVVPCLMILGAHFASGDLIASETDGEEERKLRAEGANKEREKRVIVTEHALCV
jgi:hypothetical protein